MPVAAVARAFYGLVTALSERAERESRRVWRELDPAALSGSWSSSRAADRLYVGVSTLQLAAAQEADGYLARLLTEQGSGRDPAGQVIARSLAGIASDGRDLGGLLLQPLIGTTAAIRAGSEPDQAMAAGESALATIATTQVADAGRSATAIAAVADRSVTSYVRILVPPACGRCAVLAGRRYRYSRGFLRHPRCDCQMIPAAEDAADDLRTDPHVYFASLSEAEQDRLFGTTTAQAIRDGRDISRAVNAARGSRSGLSQPGRERRRGSRRMPDEVIETATTRAEAIIGLRQAGYLT